MRLGDLENHRSGQGWIRRHKLAVGIGSLALIALVSLLQGLNAVHRESPKRLTQAMPLSREAANEGQEELAQSPVIARLRVTEGALRECGDARVVRVLELRQSGRGSETIHREQIGCSRQATGEVLHRMVARFQMGRQLFAIHASELSNAIAQMGERIDENQRQLDSANRRSKTATTGPMLAENDHGLQIWWGQGSYVERRSKQASSLSTGAAAALPTFQAPGAMGQTLFEDLVKIVGEHAEVDATHRAFTR